MGNLYRAERHRFNGMTKPQPRHFSMIREFHLADAFTLANACLGTGAVLCFMRACVDESRLFFWLGTALLPIALVMDVLDGRVARRRGVPSPLGQRAGLARRRRLVRRRARAMAFRPACAAAGCAVPGLLRRCGISRLARYNVTAAVAVRGRAARSVLRRHADPDQRAAGRRCWRVAAWRALGRRLPCGVVSIGGVGPAPAGAVFVASGSADDQQDAAHPQALITQRAEVRIYCSRHLISGVARGGWVGGRLAGISQTEGARGPPST